MSRAVVIVLGLMLLAGCSPSVKVNVPPVNISRGGSSVDSSRVPRTSTHGQCRQELERAYARIRQLEGTVRKRERKIDDLERDKDELKEDVKRLKKQLKKYQDD